MNSKKLLPRLSMRRRLPIILGILSLALISSPVSADTFKGVTFPDVVPKQDFQERIQEPGRVEPMAAEVDEWGMRLSPGVTVWFFEEEDTEVGPALYLDVWKRSSPWNYRVGVEGAHIGLEQDSAETIKEWPDKEARITYMRIPFSLEYIWNLSEETNLYLGGGPDIVHTANDNSDTSVGAHLGVRLGYEWNENWGIAVEGGYMWGKVDTEEDGDIKLDGAYITPLVTYAF